MRFRLRNAFLCQNCREICGGGCSEKLLAIRNGTYKPGDKGYKENSDLIGRKNLITCLGQYCDEPCGLQMKEITPYPGIPLEESLLSEVKYLGNKVNQLLEEKHSAGKI